MKKLLCSILFASALLPMQAQVKMPAPSPVQTIKQYFGIGSIELKCSRPSAKGRTVYGDLVPYGKLWRTGANAATMIKFTEPVEIKGKRIDTGSYALYTIPGVDQWEIVLNKGISNWGTSGYKESDDVARIKVEPSKIKSAVETFTMQFANIKPESCDLQIMWSKTSVTIPITANFKDKVRAQMEAAMLSEKKPYWQAAQFYNEYDKNSAKALENATKSIGKNPDAYWM